MKVIDDYLKSRYSKRLRRRIGLMLQAEPGFIPKQAFHLISDKKLNEINAAINDYIKSGKYSDETMDDVTEHFNEFCDQRGYKFSSNQVVTAVNNITDRLELDRESNCYCLFSQDSRNMLKLLNLSPDKHSICEKFQDFLDLDILEIAYILNHHPEGLQ